MLQNIKELEYKNYNYDYSYERLTYYEINDFINLLEKLNYNYELTQEESEIFYKIETKIADITIQSLKLAKEIFEENIKTLHRLKQNPILLMIYIDYYNSNLLKSFSEDIDEIYYLYEKFIKETLSGMDYERNILFKRILELICITDDIFEYQIKDIEKIKKKNDMFKKNKKGKNLRKLFYV